MTDPITRLHYAANGNFVNGAYAPGVDGFNLADVGGKDGADALPAGVLGLVWMGDTIGGATGIFQAQINSMIGDGKIYGFYLADEPGAGNAANLKAEADYIHSVDPGAKTFMVEQNLSSPYAPQFVYNHANTDIDLFGFDPYPVRSDLPGGFQPSIITTAVNAAEAQGISQSEIVPVYQAFGNEAPWVTPTAAQEQVILSTWGSVIPSPAFDAVYSWGTQNGDMALANDPALQAVFAAHNALTGGSPPPAPPPPAPPPLAPPPPPPPVPNPHPHLHPAKADFNGDGRSDLLWQSGDGRVLQSLTNGNLVSVSNNLGNAGDPAWHIVGAGDFNGDGKSGILWQNDDGHVWQSLMDGAEVTGSNDLGNAGNPGWHVVGTGDFDGDGKSDILWQNDDGHVWQSLMNGGQVIESNDLGNAGNPSWHVAGEGDFNGDGKSDILWQNDDGHVWLSDMNGGNVIDSRDLGNAGNSTWHVAATGDFNGDGKADILWQSDSGQVWESLMNNASVIGSFDRGNNNNPAWHIAATGDYNGDGNADILWQKDDGHIWQSLMNGGQVIASNDLGNAGNTSWHVLALT